MICIAACFLAALPVVDEFNKLKSIIKASITFTLSLIIGIATYWMNTINDGEIRKEKELARIDGLKRDSLNKLENKKELEENSKHLIETFGAIMLKPGQTLEKILPAISPFNLKTTKKGLLITYEVYKKIERLELVILPEDVFESTFERAFGNDVFTLPTTIGRNSYVLTPD